MSVLCVYSLFLLTPSGPKKSVNAGLARKQEMRIGCIYLVVGASPSIYWAEGKLNTSWPWLLNYRIKQHKNLQKNLKTKHVQHKMWFISHIMKAIGETFLAHRETDTVCMKFQLLSDFVIIIRQLLCMLLIIVLVVGLHHVHLINAALCIPQ